MKSDRKNKKGVIKNENNQKANFCSACGTDGFIFNYGSIIQRKCGRNYRRHNHS